MTHGVTFEQATSAAAYTGKDIFTFVDENNEKIPEKTWSKNPEPSINENWSDDFYTATALSRYSSTLLLHSGMFELIGDLLKNSATFAFPEQNNTNGPRDILARISNYIHIEDPDALAKFIARNRDITDLLELAARKTVDIPQYTSGQVSVFSEPEESDYCVYINADFSVESYEIAYALDNRIFEEVISPYFKLINFRILLSFDTDSDD